MEEEKQEKLPIDAKLLSEAVIELNISRRSVGLYPPDHPITRQSIKNAFDYLQKLFELRTSITLGITKDTLVIDEFTFDRKNPVFKEFAAVLHGKGISGVTFISGITEEELLALHELLVTRDIYLGQEIAEFAEKKGMRHVRLSFIDLSKFRFVEGASRKSDTGDTLWEDYIYGLLEGRLANDGSEGFITNIPPEAVAHLINNFNLDTTPSESYDRIITAYLRKKEGQGLSSEALNRFVTFLDNLTPEAKAQFLSRTSSHMHIDEVEVENILREITPDDVDKIMHVFEKHSSLPQSLRNLMDKLSVSQKDKWIFDTGGKSSLVHDIELDENMIRLFEEDNFKVFVSKDYQMELEELLNAPEAVRTAVTADIEKSCSTQTLDDSLLDIMLELLDFETISSDDYLKLLTKISEQTDILFSTGRLRQINAIYNVLYSHSLTGRFKTEALSMLEYFFRSSRFIFRLIEAIRLWGRNDREAALMLARNLGRYTMHPLLDALSEESEPSTRKLLLYVLSGLGSDVLPEALKMLNDERWYVARNMIYLIRECGGSQHAKQIRQFAKHKNKKVSFEAVRTLIHFNTPDAFSHLKLYLTSNDPDLRNQAVGLAGVYKVTDAVPYLLEMLKKKDIIGRDIDFKIQVIRTLGKIRDPRAVNVLIMLYNSRSIFFKGGFEELRVEIFRSLENYPVEPVKPLLQAGQKSKNDEIRNISEKLIARTDNE
jgi:hypothetical protein